ncbi:MAG TPA: hypothetical protein VN823_11115 [Stellaceae bacterium]|nr:hypothetical protein [Stellaceae bacterium]
MKRIVIAAALAVAVPLGLANAAGPFDGTYTGGSPPMGRQGCPASDATVTITDGKITGKYKISSYTFPISGTVAPDGTVTGKWSVYPLTGKIAGGHFAGSYNSKECKGDRPINLDKTG